MHKKLFLQQITIRTTHALYEVHFGWSSKNFILTVEHYKEVFYFYIYIQKWGDISVNPFSQIVIQIVKPWQIFWTFCRQF